MASFLERGARADGPAAFHPKFRKLVTSPAGNLDDDNFTDVVLPVPKQKLPAKIHSKRKNIGKRDEAHLCLVQCKTLPKRAQIPLSLKLGVKRTLGFIVIMPGKLQGFACRRRKVGLGKEALVKSIQVAFSTKNRKPFFPLLNRIERHFFRFFNAFLAGALDRHLQQGPHDIANPFRNKKTQLRPVPVTLSGQGPAAANTSRGL